MTSNKTKQSTKRLFIETINTSETSNEKVIEFNEPLINVKEIKLNFIQLYNSFDNISSNLGNNKFTVTTVLDTRDRDGTRRDDSFTLPDGFYTLEDIENELNTFLNGSFSPAGEYISKDVKGKVKVKFLYDEINNKLTIHLKPQEGFTLSDFRLSSNALDMFGFRTTNVVPIPRKGQNDVKLNPYMNFYVHCNLVSNTLYNGKESDILCILPFDRNKQWWDPITYRNIGCTFKPTKKEINSLKLWITDKKGKHIDFNGYPILYELKIEFENEDNDVTQLNMLTDDIHQLVKRINCALKDAKFPDEKEQLDAY